METDYHPGVTFDELVAEDHEFGLAMRRLLDLASKYNAPLYLQVWGRPLNNETQDGLFYIPERIGLYEPQVRPVGLALHEQISRLDGIEMQVILATLRARQAAKEPTLN